MKRRWATGLLVAGCLMALADSCRSRRQPEIRVAHIYEPLAGPVYAACLKWFEGVADQFKKLHPDFTVRFEQVQWDKIDSKMMNDYRAGVGHDVVMSSPQLMPQHFETGDLLNLCSYLQKWPAGAIEDFTWAPSWNVCSSGTMCLGIPTGVHTRVVIYRKDYFRDAGLDPEKPPATLEGILDAAKKLTRDTNGDGKTDVWGLGLYMGPERATIELYFAPLLWHFGGDLWDPTTRQATFASTAGVRAAEWLRDCIHVHKVTPPTAMSGRYDGLFEAFMRGETAMAWGWGNYWNEELEKKGWTKGLHPPTPGGQALTVGTFVTPTRDGAQFTNCWTISIHKLSRHPDAAFSFIETMLLPENLDRYPDASLPARKTMWERPQFANDWYRTWRQAAERGRPMPATSHFNHLADSIAVALQNIVLRKADPAPTLKRYQDEFNRRYAKP